MLSAFSRARPSAPAAAAEVEAAAGPGMLPSLRLPIHPGRSVSRAAGAQEGAAEAAGPPD